MKGFMEAIREEDLYHTGPLHKATGGQRYSKTHWTRTTQRSVIIVKGSPQILTNLGESLIPCPVLGPSPNEV